MIKPIKKNQFWNYDLPSIGTSNIDLTAKQIYLFYNVQFLAYVDVIVGV